MAGTEEEPRVWESDESGGCRARWDLHAMDDGSGLLIPIFAMLAPGQDGGGVYGKDGGGNGRKGRKRERRSMDREETRLAMYGRDCVNGCW